MKAYVASSSPACAWSPACQVAEAFYYRLHGLIRAQKRGALAIVVDLVDRIPPPVITTRYSLDVSNDSVVLDQIASWWVYAR